MDLRNQNLSQEELDLVKGFIKTKQLCYQPFIFSDDIEVGKGLQMFKRDPDEPNVLWNENDIDFNGPLAKDKTLFRDCNEIYREIYYEHLLDSLIENLENDITGLTFSEMGCNSGYFPVSLSKRGAKRAIGYDIPNNSRLFDLFNNALSTKAEYRKAEWNSLEHKLYDSEFIETDVVLSVAVLCHMSDAIYHLAYLCDHAKKAIFIYTTTNEDNCLSMSFGQLPKKAIDWPLNLDLNVSFSLPLLKLALCEAGFEDFREIKCPELPKQWEQFSYTKRAFMAFRTHSRKTVFGSNKWSRNQLRY
jgi:hypothetical protein